MSYAQIFWAIWLALLKPFAWAHFTRIGFGYFVEWITALTSIIDEHTITGSVTALDRCGDWRALERFAEHGLWDDAAVTAVLTRQVEQAPGRLGYGYHISAVDDTKVHRNSPNVWGTGTFHEYTARCPNRASTVRAHNWVVCGACSTTMAHPPGSCLCRGACTSGSRSYRRVRTIPTQRWCFTPSVNGWWTCCGNRAASWAVGTWGSSMVPTRCRAWSGP